MVRKTVYLDRSQYIALRKMARQRKVSLSSLGREAIALVIRKYRRRIA